jgi:hypothetical protein
LNSSQPPNPVELTAARDRAQPSAAPTLPVRWRAQLLLTPFGDMQPPMAHYDQLVVADVTYDYSGTPWMRVSLYLIEDLRYFDFMFNDGKWYWLISTPGGRIEGYYGPFETPLKIPVPDFIGAMGGRYGNTWEIMGTACDGWVIPTDQEHGSWYSFRTDTGNLSRIFTFDTDNPASIPILGSYYLANVAAFAAQASSEDLQAYVQSTTAMEASATFANPMVTQQDVQRALAAPLSCAPCSVQQIQALIPGLVPTPGGTLPVWSDKTYITGWTIGTDFIPYNTYVYYWYSYGHQQSTFYGLGLQPGKGTYDDAQCTCLYSFAGEPSKDYTDIPQYKFTGGQWTPLCCEEPIPGLGVPRPDWVAAVNGEIAASITGNPAFGCKPGETLNLIRCPFQRGPDEQALFWVWFTASQLGVLFTEANFVKSTDHSLQLIDYTLFERNASWINSSNFNDPCPKLPRCPSSRALARRPSERRVLGPRGVGGAPIASAS